MNWQGWVFMLIVWFFVGAIFFYSLYRIIFDERVGLQNKEEVEDRE